jgi:hypothetical protein
MVGEIYPIEGVSRLRHRSSTKEEGSKIPKVIVYDEALLLSLEHRTMAVVLGGIAGFQVRLGGGLYERDFMANVLILHGGRDFDSGIGMVFGFTSEKDILLFDGF